MFQILLIIVLILTILLIAEYKLYYTSWQKDFQKLPGMKRLPIIGNLMSLVFKSQTQIFYYSRHVASVHRNKENICKGQIISARAVNLYDPRDMETLLSSSKNLQKGFLYDIIHPWLNEGLLTSKGEKWQMRRKILTPAFHFNVLKQFVRIFQEKSEQLVINLQDEVGKSETEIHTFIADFSLNVISETAMGTNLDITNANVTDYKKAIHQMGQIFIKRASRFWLMIPPIYKVSSTRKEEKHILKRLHGLTTSVIRERRSMFVDNDNAFDNCGLEDDSVGLKKRMAMLDLLLKSEAEGKIDERGIREEVDTFMFAGHDTTSISITYTLMLLANNPEAQMLVVNEIDKVMETQQQPCLEDYNKLTYLEMCIKESLRLYPSVPIISRHLTEDLQIRNYIIPSGVMIMMLIFDMHRDPNLYPDPDRFVPERFLPENIKKRHPYAYIPFSAGPRNCIGQKFAMIQEKVVISTILKKYKLKPVTAPDDVIFVSDIVLRPRSPIKVKFVLRDV